MSGPCIASLAAIVRPVLQGLFLGKLSSLDAHFTLDKNRQNGKLTGKYVSTSLPHMARDESLLCVEGSPESSCRRVHGWQGGFCVYLSAKCCYDMRHRALNTKHRSRCHGPVEPMGDARAKASLAILLVALKSLDIRQITTSCTTSDR